jgi:hypothetical protein
MVNKKDLIDIYVNSIIDSMSHKLIEEELYEYIVKNYNKKSKRILFRKSASFMATNGLRNIYNLRKQSTGAIFDGIILLHK